MTSVHLKNHSFQLSLEAVYQLKLTQNSLKTDAAMPEAYCY